MVILLLWHNLTIFYCCFWGGVKISFLHLFFIDKTYIKLIYYNFCIFVKTIKVGYYNKIELK